MRTLNQQEVTTVSGAGALANLLAALGLTTVNVAVVAQKPGSVDVSVINKLTNVLVNVKW